MDEVFYNETIEVTGVPANALNIIVTSLNDCSNIPDTLWLVSTDNLTGLAVNDDGNVTQLTDLDLGANYYSEEAISTKTAFRSFLWEAPVA